MQGASVIRNFKFHKIPGNPMPPDKLECSITLLINPWVYVNKKENASGLV